MSSLKRLTWKPVISIAMPVSGRSSASHTTTVVATLFRLICSA
jgi:hypothetical protein